MDIVITDAKQLIMKKEKIQISHVLEYQVVGEPIYYVYVWEVLRKVEDENNSYIEWTPFYIGKGKGNRYKSTSSRNKDFKEIYSKGKTRVRILQSGLYEEYALTIEKHLIETRMDKYPLTNKESKS